MKKKKSKRSKHRRYSRDYGHPTPTTVSPELREQEDAMIDAGNLSDKAMFRELGFDQMGMVETSFRSYASKRRRATGMKHVGKTKVESTARMLFRFLSNTFPMRIVNRVAERMLELGKAGDVEAPM